MGVHYWPLLAVTHPSSNGAEVIDRRLSVFVIYRVFSNNTSAPRCAGKQGIRRRSLERSGWKEAAS
jgi:hypothetical protein